jgi:hypothetical protein
MGRYRLRGYTGRASHRSVAKKAAELAVRVAEMSEKAQLLAENVQRQEGEAEAD